MSKNTQFAEYGEVVDNDGVVHKTKTTVLEFNGYVPYSYITPLGLSNWFTSSGLPCDKVKAFVVKNIGQNNILSYTEEQIADVTGVGLSTVKRTMKSLVDANIIKNISHGKWFINPDNFYMGKAKKRDDLAAQYRSIKTKKRKGVEE